MDALQGVTFALTSAAEPLTVSATLDYQLSVQVVSDSKFLPLLFDAAHPKMIVKPLYKLVYGQIFRHLAHWYLNA